MLHEQNFLNGFLFFAKDELNKKPIPLLEETQRYPTSNAAPSLQNGPSKRKCPTTPSKSSNKRIHRSPSSPQLPLEAFIDVASNRLQDTETPETFSSSASTSSSSTLHSPRYRFNLHISDTKTRRTFSLPTEEDAYGTRLQLMLYHRLLDSLLATAYGHGASTTKPRHLKPLNFSALWRKLRLDPFKHFSETFMVEAGLVVANSHPVSGGRREVVAIDCLNSLTAAWKQSARALAVEGVDPMLTLVYRMQPSKKLLSPRTADGRVNQSKPVDSSRASLSTTEDDELMFPGLQHALQASLLEATSGKPIESEDTDLEFAQLERLRAFVSGEDVTTLTPDLQPKSATEPSIAPHTAYVPTSSTTNHDAEKSRLTETPIFAVDDDTNAPSPPDSTVIGDSQDTTIYTTASESMSQDDTHPSVDKPTTISNAAGHDASQKSQESQGSSIYMTASESLSPSPSDEEDSSDQSAIGAFLESLRTKARIIGSKTFEMDDEALDRHLQSVLKWWHGLRPPRGVPIEKTRRCECVILISLVFA